jgi:hypothetical protein
VTRPSQGDEGQAALELALVLPLVVTFLLAVVQAGLVVRDQVLVVHAAREAAREAAVTPNAAAVRAAALDGSALAPGRAAIAIHDRGAPGSRVRVEVRYRSPTDLPLVGVALGDIELRASASMRVEQ